MEFREKQNEFKKNCKININELKNTLLCNSSLLSHYSNIYKSVNTKVSKENAVNLLEELISLYLRIRSHSFAKDVKEIHKVKNKKLKEHSLRKTI